MVSTLTIWRFIMYLVAFASSSALAVFLFPVKYRLATCLALVATTIAIHSVIMEVLLLDIFIRGDTRSMWVHLLLTLDATSFAVTSTLALFSFRRLGRNSRGRDT